MLKTFLSSFFGSFIGFVFALFLFYISEKKADRAKMESARKTFEFIAQELQEKISQDPKLFKHISIEVLNVHLPYIFKNEVMNECFKIFHMYYSQWIANAYLGTRVNQTIGKDKVELQKLVTKLERLEITTREKIQGNLLRLFQQ